MSKSAAKDLPKRPHWDVVIAPLMKSIERSSVPKDEDRALVMRILRSPALAMAFENWRDETTTIDDVRSAIDRILDCMQHIYWSLPYRANPAALFKYETVDLQREAMRLLQKARDALGRIDRAAPYDYSRNITTLLGTVAGDPLLTVNLSGFFNRKNLRRKGGAANRESAFNALMVRELSERIPATAPKRIPAIVELLALIDIHVNDVTKSLRY